MTTIDVQVMPTIPPKVQRNLNADTGRYIFNGDGMVDESKSRVSSEDEDFIFTVYVGIMVDNHMYWRSDKHMDGGDIFTYKPADSECRLEIDDSGHCTHYCMDWYWEEMENEWVENLTEFEVEWNPDIVF